MRIVRALEGHTAEVVRRGQRMGMGMGVWCGRCEHVSMVHVGVVCVVRVAQSLMSQAQS